MPTIGPEPRPKAPRQSLAFLVGSLAGGNLVSIILNMAGGILLARLVAPSTLGFFNGIGLVLGYAAFLQLGVINGLNRELPFHIGRGDRQRATELAAAAQAWALAVGGTVCLALLVVAGWYLAQGDLWRAAGWLTNALLAVLLFYKTHYLQATYRTASEFARLALVGVVESAAGLALLVLVGWFNFYGMCLRAVAVGAIGAVLLFHWRPVRVGPRWSISHLKHLLRIGAPILGVGQLYAWWFVVNSTLVLRFAGTEGLGLYSVVVMGTAALQLVPSAVSQVIYPRMAEQYGRDESLRGLIRSARKPILLSTVGLVPLVAAAWFLAGPAVRLAIPAYLGAVPALRWALLLPLVSSLSPALNAFNVVRRQDLYVVAMLLGMAAYGGSLMLLIHGGVDLLSFPQAMLVGQAVFVAVSYLFLAYLVRRTSGA